MYGTGPIGLRIIDLRQSRKFICASYTLSIALCVTGNAHYILCRCVQILEASASSSMAPRSRWQKRARLMVAARQPRRSDGSMMNVSTTEWIEHDDELMLLNDEQMGPVMSRLQWQKCAGSHLRKAYNGTSRSTVFARKAMLKKRQQIMLGSRPLTSYFARQSSTISDPSPNVTETSGDTTCASPSLDGWLVCIEP